MTGQRPPAAALGADDVLVLRALGLGDALTAVAALRGVRRAWPDRRLVLAGPPGVGSWLAGLGVVDAVLPAVGLDPSWARDGTTRGSGHVAVNLHGRGPQSHTLLGLTGPAELIAFDCREAEHEGLPWRSDEHEVTRWCRLVTSAGGRCGAEDLRLPVPGLPPHGAVVLHPGAASASRRWPVRRWAELAARLAADGQEVLVTGSAAEEGLCRGVTDAVPGVRSTAGRLGVEELAATVAGARLLVCGDTGVAHLATAFATPSVLLFGPTPPAWWGPAIDPGRHTVLWHGTGPGDPHGSAVDPALTAVTVAQVHEAAAALLAVDPVRQVG